jgi:4-amino-4-deoxy-L-arabinose transferase-like glycosyltransferase
VGLLVVHVYVVWTTRVPALGYWPDEARYVMLARSLRQFRYQDFFSIGSPAHSQYPPVFPAILALGSLPFGEHLDLMVATVCLCSVVALAFSYDVIRRLSGPGVALAVLAILAVNPDLNTASGHLLSDIPFFMFSAIAVWGIVRESEASGDGRARGPALAIIVGVAAILGALTRTAGVTLLAAIFVVWLFERRYRRAAIFAVAAAVTVGSWLAWSLSRPDALVGRSYVADFKAGAAPKAGTRGGGFISRVALRVPANVSDYATVELPRALPQPTVVTIGKHLNWSPSNLALGATADSVIAVASLILFGGLGVWSLWKLNRFVVAYLAFTCSLLAIWTWPIYRFLWPLMPIIVWGLVLGAISLATWRRWFRPVPFLLVGGILAMAAAHDVQVLREQPLCDRRSPTTSGGCFDDVTRGFFSAAAFIRSETPDSAAFLVAPDAQFAYLTGRKTVFSPVVARFAPESLLSVLRVRHVGYVVLTPLRSPRQQLVPTLAASCRELEPVRDFGASTVLLQIAPPNAAPAGDACDTIDRYSKSVINKSLWDPR